MAFNLPTQQQAREFLEAQRHELQLFAADFLAPREPGPFQRAVAGGEVDLVREMLAAGEDPNRLDETGECAINWAIGRVVCPQVRRLIDMYRERHPDREDDPRLQRLSDSLAALEVSVGLDPGVETNPIQADWSDSEG